MLVMFISMRKKAWSNFMCEPHAEASATHQADIKLMLQNCKALILEKLIFSTFSLRIFVRE